MTPAEAAFWKREESVIAFVEYVHKACWEATPIPDFLWSCWTIAVFARPDIVRLVAHDFDSIFPGLPPGFAGRRYGCPMSPQQKALLQEEEARQLLLEIQREADAEDAAFWSAMEYVYPPGEVFPGSYYDSPSIWRHALVRCSPAVQMRLIDAAGGRLLTLGKAYSYGTSAGHPSSAKPCTYPITR